MRTQLEDEEDTSDLRPRGSTSRRAVSTRSLLLSPEDRRGGASNLREVPRGGVPGGCHGRGARTGYSVGSENDHASTRPVTARRHETRYDSEDGPCGRGQKTTRLGVCRTLRTGFAVDETRRQD